MGPAFFDPVLLQVQTPSRAACAPWRLRGEIRPSDAIGRSGIVLAIGPATLPQCQATGEDAALAAVDFFRRPGGCSSPGRRGGRHPRPTAARPRWVSPSIWRMLAWLYRRAYGVVSAFPRGPIGRS